jgi:hypothetical protein
MSDLVTLGIVKPDGSFVTTVTRHDFLLPKIMTPGFLSGDPGIVERLLPNDGSGHWNNHPAGDGYILIDTVERKILDWHQSGQLNLVAQEHLGFGRNATANGARIRDRLRPFIVGATYLHQGSMEFIEHRFEPCSTDKQLRKVMDMIAYEGLGKSLFYTPRLVNLVSYEVTMPAWEYERLPYDDLSGFTAIREQVQARTALSESDGSAWDSIYAEMTRVSPMAEAWDNVEKLLYPNGLPGRTP